MYEMNNYYDTRAREKSEEDNIRRFTFLGEEIRQGENRRTTQLDRNPVKKKRERKSANRN